MHRSLQSVLFMLAADLAQMRGPKRSGSSALNLSFAPVVDGVMTSRGWVVARRDLRVPADHKRVRVGDCTSLRAPAYSMCSSHCTPSAESRTLPSSCFQCASALVARQRPMRTHFLGRRDISCPLDPGRVLAKASRIRARIASERAPVSLHETAIAVWANDRHFASRPPLSATSFDNLCTVRAPLKTPVATKE